MKKVIREVSHAFLQTLKNGESYDQYAHYAAEKDEATVISNLQFMERMQPDCVLMLCQMSHPKLKYVSASAKYILGFSEEEFKAKTVAEFFSLVHPDDVEGVQRCFEFINVSEPYDPEVYRFGLHYRFQYSPGHYIYLYDEKLAIRNDSGTYIYFTLFRDITSTHTFTQVKLSVLQKIKNVFSEVYCYYPKHGETLITPRQTDIVRLIVRGLSNKEIAERLNVSIYTIKNHKQALFRKANVRSSLELANYARQHLE